MKFILLSVLFSSLVHANSTIESRTRCSKVEGDKPFSWCTTRPLKTSSEVLYVLHGMGYNERIWIEEKESETLRTEWSKIGKSEPWVITIDFPDEGSPWALEDNLRMVFVKKLMPTAEKAIPTEITARSVMGYSMNGFSVIQLWFKNPEIFQKYAALCPAVTEPKVRIPGMFEAIFDSLVRNSPFAPAEERTKKWNRHDPMVLAPKASAMTKSRPLFLNYDEYDDFNFNSGAEKFLELNKKLKLNIISIKAKDSGHCENLDFKKLSLFL